MSDNHPPTPKKFLTNQGENTLAKRLEKILPLTQDFDCLVGYFFISGFFRLYPALEAVKKVRILIGLKNEQVVHGLIQIAEDGSDESAPSTAEVKATFGGMMKKELAQAQDTSAGFHYARYQPLNPLYYTGPMEERAVQGQRNLATFMKILLVKRLESSFYAFQETLCRFIKSHELVLQAFDDGFVYTSQKHSRKVLEFLEEGDDDAIDTLISQEKAEKFAAAKFTPVFRKHVASDLAALRGIQTSWRAIKGDPKWAEFKRELTTTFGKGKLIIFTEFADTARYLAERIKKEVEAKTLLFSSASSPELRRAVIANFDANSQSPSDDHRILLTTDVLAEGVNLHRSATVVNYDLPWNPSRMMQRVGRVNRVGTKFKTIFGERASPACVRIAGSRRWIHGE